MNRYQLAVSLALLAPLACITGPHNGTTNNASSVVNQSFKFQGYYAKPNIQVQVQVQVLKTPGADKDLASSWALIGTATTESTPTYANSDDPLYYWTVDAKPVATSAQAGRWPQGGLARFRAVAKDPEEDRILTTFDDVTFSDCFSEHYTAGDPWSVIGTECAGLGKQSSMIVSTKPSPVDSPALRDYLGFKGDISVGETELYYLVTGAPLTLTDFKNKYGFPSGEVTATYYNDGDLGIGREMHCKQYFVPTAAPFIGVACYVKNYSATPGAAGFGQNPTTVLANAVAHNGPFATVAMVYEPPANTANSVRFIVYGANGVRAQTAALDSTGKHKSIPNNCLSCHGIKANYSTSTHSVSGAAKFLPFDVFSFKYSTVAGFKQADQADELRRLNAMVKLTSPTTAISALIDGMYAPKAVTDSTAVANDKYVPTGWSQANGSLDGTAMYSGIVKPGCRTCHISSTSSSDDFLQYEDFQTHRTAIENFVCDTKDMPHAEHVLKKFWASGARAYLITGFGTNLTDHPCTP